MRGPASYARALLVGVAGRARRLLADERGYIDPGTGSMLFTILIGVVSAGIYALRNAFVKARFVLSGGRQEKGDDARKEFVIFTDSKRYWNVFEPICDEFERRGVGLTYYTASPDDPALDKPYEHVECEFVGEGNRAFAKMNMIKADVVLSSTPGLDVYQWKRSRDVKWYVHVPHAVYDITLYRMFGIDYYDALLLTGGFQIDQVRGLEEKRGLPEKEALVVGCTYMDRLAAKLAGAGPIAKGEGEGVTALLAPSWGASAIFSLYGGKVIDALLAAGCHVIVRPHPQSFTSEKELMDSLMAAYPDSDRLEWNRDNDNFEALRRSDILVTDFSGVVLDFTLVFDRPVVYTEPNIDKAPYDACWLDEELWVYKALPKLGKELDDGAMDGIGGLVESLLGDAQFQSGRDEVREECWEHPGEAATRVVDYLIAKQKELSAEGAPSDS